MRKAIVTTSFMLLAGCRNPGLPPEPPEHDAANPEAGLVEAKPHANPFTRSAFEGVDLEGAGGHEHHHHHGHGAHGAEPPAGERAPVEGEPEEAAEEPSHAGHGSHAPKGGRS